MRSSVSRSTRIDGLVEFGLDFLRIEDVKQHDFVAVEAQRLDGADDRLRRFVEIGDDHHEAAARRNSWKWCSGLAKSVRARGSASSRPLSRRWSWPWRVEGRM